MKKINVILTGSSGKMGQSIKELIDHEKNLELFAQISKDTKSKEANHYESLQKIESIPENSVIIDFSHPSLFSAVLMWATQNKIPMVSGTTGIANEQFAQLEESAKTIPLLWASNMSVGIAFVRKLLKQFSGIGDFDFQISETHHNEKVDKPSGTAKTLQEDLAHAVNKNLPEVHSTRSGGIFGIHTISACSKEEMITLEHQALNRQVFAKGALRAANWLVSQPAGKYEFLDIIQ